MIPACLRRGTGGGALNTNPAMKAGSLEDQSALPTHITERDSITGVINKLSCILGAFRTCILLEM